MPVALANGFNYPWLWCCHCAGKDKVRLYGIDAPEKSQSCTDEKGQTYSCGKASTDALQQIVGKNTLRCEVSRRKWRCTQLGAHNAALQGLGCLGRKGTQLLIDGTARIVGAYPGSSGCTSMVTAAVSACLQLGARSNWKCVEETSKSSASVHATVGAQCAQLQQEATFSET